MRRIISIATGEGRPPCLPLGLFEGAPGQNLPDHVHLVSPSCPRPWPRSPDHTGPEGWGSHSGS